MRSEGVGVRPVGWLEQHQQGRFQINVDTSHVVKEHLATCSVARMATTGVVLLGMITGSAIAASYSALLGDSWSLLPRVAPVGYTVSILAAAVIVVN